MLNVIFRCRERMAVIYGRVEPGELAGQRFARAPGAALPAGRPQRPGELTRSGERVSLRPMPRRTGR
jgi:hypothetical protein